MKDYSITYVYGTLTIRRLNPAGLASRAEVAAMLMRYTKEHQN